MEYRYIGRTGLRVTPICLGTMSFGSWSDEKESFKIMDKSIDRGVNFFDTAELYAGGISEKILGEAIESWDGKRSELFLASKINGDNAYPERIHQACKESLQRMGIKYFDLYYLHWRNLEFDLKAQIPSIFSLTF